MADDTPARRFAAALRKLESDGEKSSLVGMFTDDAELLRPEVAKEGSSSDDAEQYWDAYAAQFSQIRTDFGHVREEGASAWLEWTSSGSLSTGRDIEYSGVSLLELDDDGQVTRFATYYDTAAFLEPES